MKLKLAIERENTTQFHGSKTRISIISDSLWEDELLEPGPQGWHKVQPLLGYIGNRLLRVRQYRLHVVLIDLSFADGDFLYGNEVLNLSHALAELLRRVFTTLAHVEDVSAAILKPFHCSLPHSRIGLERVDLAGPPSEHYVLEVPQELLRRSHTL